MLAIVGQGMVQRAAIVPEKDVMALPHMAVDEFGPRAELEQLLHQRVRFVFGQAGEADRMAFIDVECLASGVGMGADDWVGDLAQ